MKATEQYFPLVLFILLYRVVISFDSMDEIVKCDHQMKLSPVICCGSVYYAVRDGLTFEPVDEIFNKLLSRTFLFVFYAMHGVLNF